MKSALLTLPLVAFLAATADTPTFVPKNRAVVKRTLSMKGTRDLKAESMDVAGEHQDNPEPFRKIDMGWKHVVTDTYDKCAGDRVERLKRSYESLAKNRSDKGKDPKGNEATRDIVETCDLEGKTVTFAWDAAKETYAASFEDDSDKELLKDLDLDMDYRAFLPEGEVKPGDKWVKDFADVKSYLLRPGGDLPFHTDTPARPMDLRMRAAVWDATKGKIDFELKPATGEGDERVAHIRFTGTIAVEAATEPEGDEKGPQRLEVKDDQTFEGELVWDMHANRARSLEWSSKGTLLFKVSDAVKSPTGEEATLVHSFTYDCAYDYTGSFEEQ